MSVFRGLLLLLARADPPVGREAPMTVSILYCRCAMFVQDFAYGGQFWGAGCVDNQQCARGSVVACTVDALVSAHGRVDDQTAKTVGRADHPLMFAVCRVLRAVRSPRFYFQGSLALCETYVRVALFRPVELAVIAAQS